MGSCQSAAAARRTHPSGPSAGEARRAQVEALQKRLVFAQRCEAAEIGWLSFGYLRQLEGRPLPRRQDLPRQALIAGAPSSGAVPWVVSHAWLGKEHADPMGQQVAEVVQLLQRLGARDADLVFYDYGSMHQRSVLGEDDRTEEQLGSFKKQLGCINMLYASDLCKVVVVNSISDSVKDLPSVEAKVPGTGQPVSVTTNTTPYEDRGWCFFELVVTLMFGTCANLGPEHEQAVAGIFDNFLGIATFLSGAESPAIAVAKGKQLTMASAEERLRREAAFEECIEAGHIRLVRFGFLRGLATEAAARLPRRQDCPREAFGDHRRCCMRFAVSHCWASRDHPDPDGSTLRMIVSRLLRLGVGDDDLVFLDFVSLFQAPYTEAERATFSESMRHVNVAYTGARFRTCAITSTPEGTLPYESRGWTLFELVVSAFSGNLVYDDPGIVNIVLGKFFLPNLEKKTFTNGKTDMLVVAGLFKSLLYERAGMSLLSEEKDRQIEALKARIKSLEAQVGPSP